MDPEAAQLVEQRIKTLPDIGRQLISDFHLTKDRSPRNEIGVNLRIIFSVSL